MRTLLVFAALAALSVGLCACRSDASVPWVYDNVIKGGPLDCDKPEAEVFGAGEGVDRDFLDNECDKPVYEPKCGNCEVDG